MVPNQHLFGAANTNHRLTMKKHSLGFTLVEVLIALALFAMSSLMLSQSFVNGLVCKHALLNTPNDTLPLESVRQQLHTISFDKIGSDNKIYLINNETIHWSGKANSTKLPYLFDVQISFENDKETIHHFWIYRPDWDHENSQSTQQFLENAKNYETNATQSA